MNRRESGEPEHILFSLLSNYRLLEARELANEIVNKVYSANSENLVYGKNDAPDIYADIVRFLSILQECGFFPPEDPETVYRQIIKPLHIEMVGRGV